MSSPVRVSLGGGTVLSRSVLAAALESHGVRAAAWDTWPELVRAVTASGGVVLVPERLDDGFDLVTELPRLVALGGRVLVACARESLTLVPDLLFSGASGFVLTDECTAAQLAGAVAGVAAGDASLHPAVATAVLRQWRALREDRQAPPTIELTPAEQRVLAAMVDGATTRTIARGLGVSPKTVESHTSRLYGKLQVRTRAQAVQVALDRQLVVG